MCTDLMTKILARTSRAQPSSMCVHDHPSAVLSVGFFWAGILGGLRDKVDLERCARMLDSFVFRLSKSQISVSQRCLLMPLHLIPPVAWDPLRKVKANLAKAAPENMLKLLAANSLSFGQCHMGLPFSWHCRGPTSLRVDMGWHF